MTNHRLSIDLNLLSAAVSRSSDIIGLRDILALSVEEFQARIARGATELKREPPTELTMVGWWEQAKTLEEE